MVAATAFALILGTKGVPDTVILGIYDGAKNAWFNQNGAPMKAPKLDALPRGVIQGVRRAYKPNTILVTSSRWRQKDPPTLRLRVGSSLQIPLSVCLSQRGRRSIAEIKRKPLLRGGRYIWEDPRKTDSYIGVFCVDLRILATRGLSLGVANGPYKTVGSKVDEHQTGEPFSTTLVSHFNPPNIAANETKRQKALFDAPGVILSRSKEKVTAEACRLELFDKKGEHLGASDTYSFDGTQRGFYFTGKLTDLGRIEYQTRPMRWFPLPRIKLRGK